MHEASLGGAIRDYLTGEALQRTTYEDLRQALARWLVEERGYAPDTLVPRYPVRYEAGGETRTREADIALLLPGGTPGMFLVFCAGQVGTYVREVRVLARLALPEPCPLVMVTDTREAELVSVRNGAVLGEGLKALPGREAMIALAREHALALPSGEQREKESRILHAYTGFLQTCCGGIRAF